MQWNAKGYTKDFSFVHRYGEDVLELLEVRPGEQILDLGCGNGALTQKLAEKGAKVFGMDSSPEMLKEARTAHPHLTFIEGDAVDFSLEHSVDAVFSNAVFHWIADQEGLLSSIARALRPGGKLVCEFGGKGCAEKIHAALRAAFEERGLPYNSGFYFPTVGEYAPRLEKYGLRVVFAALFDRKTPLNGENGLRDWIEMFVQRPFEGLAPAVCAQIKDEAVTALRSLLFEDGVWYADYVRIRLKAVKL